MKAFEWKKQVTLVWHFNNIFNPSKFQSFEVMCETLKKTQFQPISTNQDLSLKKDIPQLLFLKSSSSSSKRFHRIRFKGSFLCSNWVIQTRLPKARHGPRFVRLSCLSLGEFQRGQGQIIHRHLEFFGDEKFLPTSNVGELFHKAI